MTETKKTKSELIKEVNELRRKNRDLETLEAEHKQAEEALRKSQEQLFQAQKMDALGTLVAGIAHEVNNPINLIMFNISLFQKVWNDLFPVFQQQVNSESDQKFGGLTLNFLKENSDRLLSDMELATNRVVKIVTDLKNFARQSNIADKSAIQVNNAVENAIRLAQATLRKSGVQLELNLMDGLPLMEGNLQNIEQIILNILINAIQAIDHDKGIIWIQTGFSHKKNQLCISINDNGRGIATSMARVIFNPFVTDKQVEGGTGLGLSVSYSLVKAHKGEIDFKSKPGNGAEFNVYFPALGEAKTFKILVVDDDKSVRRMLTKTLTTDRPYLVDEASNGIEACIRMGTQLPDLLILDIFMPHMDGLEVCRTIRRERELSEMEVIITTGFPEHPKLKEIKKLGFTHIYFKPLDLPGLLQSIDKLREKARMPRSGEQLCGGPLRRASEEGG